jgi:hypothetical protein
MNSFTGFARAFGLAALVLVPACSSSSEDGPNSSTFSTGLPPSQSLGSISDADLKTLCAAASSFANDLVNHDSACLIAGYDAAAVQHLLGTAQTDADLQKACTDAETACKNDPARDAGTTTTTQTCRKPPASCTATVGEYEACVNDAKAAYQMQFSSLSTCAALTAADLRMPEGGPTATPSNQPASCKVVSTKCPSGVATP